VALVPPASIVGIGIALLDVEFIFSSGILLLANVICINIAGTLVFWRLKIRPGGFMEMVHSERNIKNRLFVTIVILFILGAVLSWTTWTAYQTYQLEKDINEEAESFVMDQNYEYVIGVNVEETHLDTDVFGYPKGSGEVNIVIQTNSSDDLEWNDITLDLQAHLNNKFKSEIDEGFTVKMNLQEVYISR
jgi:uncharacterized membrane protein